MIKNLFQKTGEKKAYFFQGLFALLLACLVLISCSNTIAGGGTEGGNVSKVAGYIYNPDGTPAGNVQVKLIPADFNPVADSAFFEFMIDTTDINGNYSFDFLDTGCFNILALYRTYKVGLLRKGIRVENDTIVNLADTLKAVGTIKVILSDTVDTVNGYLFIEGTGIYKKVTGKTVYLDSVPAGIIPVINSSVNGAIAALKDSVSVIPNDTVIQASVLFIARYKDFEQDSASSFMIGKIEKMGITVTTVYDSLVTHSDTSGVSAVFVSPTIWCAKRLGSIFRDASIPILNMEPFLLGGLSMTDTVKDVDFGKLSLEIESDIYDPLHSVASGLSGTVAMYSDSIKLEWGNPKVGAQKIVVAPGTLDSATVFCYEKGSQMAGLIAPAKRGAFLTNGKGVYALTDDGWHLFGNMVKWLFE